ncbi:orotate phosphoribosyltransferase [Marinilabilia salmonicolor]|jgi:orotate phosphoribosyltransferase|uniref:Orotate phosphoribosyltransferase n=1 Tax=Marinilabilia salmonicolor TaxID=989 RepID=A0A2T0XSW4_9BACT|nr:orotate phosphoribosyltransferase [Marinilabilia salmonicolor]PRZ02045.1 orotate phosphoribosyltransferase [Marinilabilia salmonicolor]RCW39480.1 orotate phosphoribosyltransferase [Marinilabilia salmonicolor]
MKNLQENIARQLLQIKAIKLQPANPFSWASGWTSPIYCDNRKTLSYPEVRDFIKIQFARRVLEIWPEVDVIAGVATGAIAQGALVADLIGKPFVYVRSSPKGHGLENLIEGDLKPGQKVVVIEDLISTGGSSLKAVEALRNNGAEVLGMLAIFSYGFKVAEDNFAEASVKYETLSDYQALLRVAVETGYVSSDELSTLSQWREDPANWKK